MDYFEVIRNRRSTRSFTEQPVEEEKLQQILFAANLSPSAGNKQAYEIYIVRDLEKRRALAGASYNQEFLIQAPIVLVFCTHAALSQPRYGERGVKLYTIQDATIACTQAILAATALGLGSVWVGAFDDQAIHQIIGAPPEHFPVAMLPIGHPTHIPEPRLRRKLEEMVHEVT
jgi:nitroreductase